MLGSVVGWGAKWKEPLRCIAKESDWVVDEVWGSWTLRVDADDVKEEFETGSWAKDEEVGPLCDPEAPIGIPISSSGDTIRWLTKEIKDILVVVEREKNALR